MLSHGCDDTYDSIYILYLPVLTKLQVLIPEETIIRLTCCVR